MLCIGGAAAVSKEQYFVSTLEHLCKFRSCFDDPVAIFLEEAGLHAQAFGDHLFDKMCSVVHFINGCAFSRGCALSRLRVAAVLPAHPLIRCGPTSMPAISVSRESAREPALCT